MSKKCKAYSESKLGLEPPDNRKAFYAGWDAALAAEQPKHPGYVIGSHWLETAYSRICAGEAEADVLRDCGWERVNEALRRENERLREALRVCLAHWLKDDDPDELQENAAKFKELCGWEDKT